MCQNCPFKVEEYVSSLEKLTTDMRFTLYNILYKRILVIWIFSAFMVLIGILFRYIISNSGSMYIYVISLGLATLIFYFFLKRGEKMTFSRPAETDPYYVIH